jgi:hypothetical protein
MHYSIVKKAIMELGLTYGSLSTLVMDTKVSSEKRT